MDTRSFGELMTCTICRVEFSPDRWHQNAVTCSTKCSEQRMNAVRREQTANRIQGTKTLCAHCCTGFTPNKLSVSVQKYCSSACQRKSSKVRALFVPKPLHNLSCSKCGVQFLAKNGRRKYCSKKCFTRVQNERSKMGGNWVHTLERDKYTCRLCGSGDRLVVHHQDGSGESDSPNHNLDNLVTLCNGCHLSVHQFNFRIIDGVIHVHSPIHRLVGYLPMVFAGQMPVQIEGEKVSS